MNEKYIYSNAICRTLIKGLLPLFILFFSSVLLQHNAYSADVTLGWSPNTEEDLAGYIIYQGTTSRFYTQSIDVGNVTECTITDLDEDIVHYFSATAYDLDGNESDYSNEVKYYISRNSTDLVNSQDGASDIEPSNNGSDAGGCFICSIFSHKRVNKR